MPQFQAGGISAQTDRTPPPRTISDGGVTILLRRVLRLVICVAAVAIVTIVAYRVLRVNAPTVGFAYLSLVLVIAGTWGFLEAAVTSIAAALSFNRYFF